MPDVRDTLLLPFDRNGLAPPTPQRPWGFWNAQVLPEGRFADALVCRQRWRGPHLDLVAAGYETQPEGAVGNLSGALVLASRHRRLDEEHLAEAAAAVGEGGTVVLAGAKSDGIGAIRRSVAGWADVLDATPKHHATALTLRVRHLPAPPPPPPPVDAMAVAHGVFSADGIDRGSALLLRHLGGSLSGRVADFGAGWGVLSRAILGHGGVARLDLFEADHAALACARANLTDPRAAFHWCDLSREPPRGPYDRVVMNPPFHEGGKGRGPQRSLGETFIRAAARVLPSGGRLLMVANAHLPYEPVLADAFRRHAELARQDGFKVIEAVR